MFEFKYGELHLDGERVSLEIGRENVRVKLGGGTVGSSTIKKIAREIKKHYQCAEIHDKLCFIQYKDETIMCCNDRLLVAKTENIWKNVKDDVLPEL